MGWFPRAGWSDHLAVTVTEVGASTPLGICQDTGSGSGMTSSNAPCDSTTLGRDVDDGTCVQAATDASWYRCDNGAWDTIASSSAGSIAYGFCDSATLGRPMPPRACVQSGSSGIWFQCNGTTWASPVSTSSESGPLGDCSCWNPR